LKVDLTQENAISVHSGSILVQAVAHLFLPWFRTISLFQSSQKGVELWYTHVLWKLW